MTDQQQQQLQLVPETVLKRKHDLDEMKAHRAAQEILNPRRSKSSRKIFNSKTKVIKIKKPESILANSRSQLHHTRRYNRVLKKGMQGKANNHVVKKVKKIVYEKDGSVVVKDLSDENVNQESLEDSDNNNVDSMEKKVIVKANSVDAKMVFIVRIREPNGMPKSVRNILNALKLKSVNEGVFCRYDTSIRKQLQLIEPWVTYGPLSQIILSDLIHRRGHLKLNGKRIPLSDNTLIEKSLGEVTNGSIICVQDLIHELYTVGEEFHTVNKFLWTFQLSAPKSKFQKDKLSFKDGGEYGDRGEEMDDLIRQML